MKNILLLFYILYLTCTLCHAQEETECDEKYKYAWDLSLKYWEENDTTNVDTMINLFYYELFECGYLNDVNVRQLCCILSEEHRYDNALKLCDYFEEEDVRLYKLRINYMKSIWTKNQTDSILYLDSIINYLDSILAPYYSTIDSLMRIPMSLGYDKPKDVDLCALYEIYCGYKGIKTTISGTLKEIRNRAREKNGRKINTNGRAKK